MMKTLIAVIASLLGSVAAAQEYYLQPITRPYRVDVATDGRVTNFYHEPFRTTVPQSQQFYANPGILFRHTPYGLQPVGSEWVLTDFHDGLGFRWVRLPKW